jgi:hypothetical protein
MFGKILFLILLMRLLYDAHRVIVLQKYNRTQSAIETYLTGELTEYNTNLTDYLLQWKLDDYLNKEAIEDIPSTKEFSKKVIIYMYAPNLKKSTPQRTLEYYAALQHNLLHPLISLIFIIGREDFLIRRNFIFSYKVNFISKEKRSETFDAIQKRFGGDYIVFTRMDIAFDYTLLNLGRYVPSVLFDVSRQRTIQGNDISLTRGGVFFDNHCQMNIQSHDALIVCLPLSGSQLDIAIRADNTKSLMTLFLQDPTKLIVNPCKDIILHHFHSDHK